jgi:hypothetical protein
MFSYIFNELWQKLSAELALNFDQSKASIKIVDGKIENWEMKSTNNTERKTINATCTKK